MNVYDQLQNVVHEIGANCLHQFVVDDFDNRMIVDTVDDVAVVDVVTVVDVVVVADVAFAVVVVEVVGIVDSVVAFVVVAASLYYLHLLRTFVAVALVVNTVVSIDCPIFVVVDFLFLQRCGPVLISVVYQTCLVDQVEVTENRQMMSLETFMQSFIHNFAYSTHMRFNATNVAIVFRYFIYPLAGFRQKFLFFAA